MSAVKKVFQSMDFDIEYDVATIKTITHLDEATIKTVLRGLEKSGVIEKTAGGRWFKDRKYRTKQRQMGF